MKKISLIALLACAVGSSNAAARGVTAYLPLRLEPEIERQIERVLILADKPVMTRPVAAAMVLDALPKACAIDAVLCRQVGRYLARFTQSAGISHASVDGGATDASGAAMPNRYGMSNASEWQASMIGYVQPFATVLLTLGGVAYDNDAVPLGSVLSIGFDRAQLDVGYRGHWLSPFTDSSMLLSTEALTMPSATLSNYLPLTRLGLHYEAFIAEMSKSDRIAFQGGFTSGNPDVFGLHLSMEPATGWSLGLNRIMQHGGGARGGNSFGDVLDAFFR
ncbi:MAG: capsule assembly Wzi family protein, partial [Steroidobacteraceae bacterium]